MVTQVGQCARYVPLLEIRPAEMLALQELPEKDKDILLPIFKLGPWVSSNKLESSISRLGDSHGRRPAYLAIVDSEPVVKRRQVHDELDELRDSRGGFDAWFKFFQKSECSHFIPLLQLTDPTQFDDQTARLYSLGRGVGAVFEVAAMAFAPTIVRRVARLTNDGENVLFVLDFGREDGGFVYKLQIIKQLIGSIFELAPNCNVCISASSFPDGFVELESQPIYEREVFNRLNSDFGGKLIYSDRGSGRAVKQLGGAGQPAPRIDLATPGHWYFFREVSSNRAEAYRRQAARAMQSPFWDPRLRVWGMQLIERTALGDSAAITSPPRAVSARINIHLHQQLHYGNEAGLYDTEEEWVD